MRDNGTELLQPVFDFIERIIRDDGDILFMVFTFAAIPFLVWVLCGGLRRKLLVGKRGVSAVTVIYLPLAPPRPPPEPPPPLIGQDYEPPCCDHEGDCHWD